MFKMDSNLKYFNVFYELLNFFLRIKVNIFEKYNLIIPRKLSNIEQIRTILNNCIMSKMRKIEQTEQH